MKKLILILAAFQLFAFSVGAQTSNDREKLKQLNQEVVANYKAGKIDDALVLAKQAVDMSVKIFGAEHEETAATYSNLGSLYRLKKKYSESAENLQKALTIYQLRPAANGRSIAKTLESLAAVYTLEGDKKKGAEYYTLALAAAEDAFGKDSREILPYLKSMSEVHIFNKKYDEAQETFVRRYQIASKTSPNDPKQLQEIEGDFSCFTFQYFQPEEAVERHKKFDEAVKTARPQVEAQPGTPLTVSGGVVNSKSSNLEKPDYPASAKERRATGRVIVQVTIDEKGYIIEARATCGDKDLRIAAENAAKKSRFKPTLLGGKPVRVTGVIIYNFVAAP